MKILNKLPVLSIVAALTLLGCEKKKAEIKVQTRAATEITTNSALLNGSIVDLAGQSLGQHGFVFATTENPTVFENKKELGPRETSGEFSTILSGLESNTTYYFRAYAQTSSSIEYDEQLSFTTLTVTSPAVSIDNSGSITETSFSISATISDDGGASVTARGFVWSLSENPALTDNFTANGSGDGSYSAVISGLECGTTYYVSAYATNSSGTSYSPQSTIATTSCPSQLPTVTTSTISNISEYAAQGGGQVSDQGSSPVTASGICWSTSENPTLSDQKTSDASGMGSFTSDMSNLSCATTYYVRAYATSEEGIAYGNQVSFITSTCPSGLASVSLVDLINVGQYAAQADVNVSDNGGSTVSTRGVCWSTSQNPTTADQKTNSGTGTGTFRADITGLDCGSTYYVRAYATTEAGTVYSDQSSLTTTACPAGLPTITLDGFLNVDQYDAQADANVTDNGGSIVTARGVCWSLSQNPTVDDQKTNSGSGTGTFRASMSGLECGTTYYVRAYATNEAGTTYSPQNYFTTADCPPGLPAVSISSITNVEQYSAQISGTVSDDGGAAVTSRGICYSTSSGPTTSDMSSEQGSGTGSFLASISSLDCNTTYYVRAYAINSAGTSYSAEQSFVTSSCPVLLPTVSTLSVSSVTSNSAQSGGNVTDEGGATVTEKGVCWSTSQNPTVFDNTTNDGSGPGTYTSVMTELSCGTTYYVRAYAKNSTGTAYGDQYSFTTGDCEETVTDIDGNVYPTVTIGDQTWMAKNLRVTRYPNGSSIPHVTVELDWDLLGNSDDAYCYYDNNSSYADTYGALYTWAAVMNGESQTDNNPSWVQGVCPDGWHVPSDSEFKELELSIGMTLEEVNATWKRGTMGGKLKQTGTSLWSSPNTGATNVTGFNAVPSGYRHIRGYFEFIGLEDNWWTCTEDTVDEIGEIWYRNVGFDGTAIIRDPGKKPNGLAVRCVKDPN